MRIASRRSLGSFCAPEKKLDELLVKRWYTDIKRGLTDTNDAERSGQPNKVVVPENAPKLGLIDRKLKLREIAEELLILEGSIFIILPENLLMRKLWSKWVLRLLRIDQKPQRWFRALFSTVSTRQKDETWIPHFIPESNQVSAEWTAAGEIRPKWPKTQTSAGKFLASVFWDAQGILLIDYLAKWRTINSEYWCP